MADTVVETTVPIVPATSARIAIVGDSQANALAINLPDGIDNVFPSVVNGSVDGCSVYDSGSVESAVEFGNNFSICDGWQQEWAQAATGTDATLVVVGAWDVFDIDDDGTFYGFATPAGDELFVTNLRSGIDAMLAQGTNVGLLEVACMRPQDVKGAGVRALPERGDDARVAHVNDLLRETAASYGTTATVAGAVRRRPRRVVQRRDDRHRPRLPLGRRARVQAGGQSDLHHGRSRPAPPRCRLNPSSGVESGRTGPLGSGPEEPGLGVGSGRPVRSARSGDTGSALAHVDQLAVEQELGLLAASGAVVARIPVGVAGGARRHRLDGDRVRTRVPDDQPGRVRAVRRSNRYPTRVPPRGCGRRR